MEVQVPGITAEFIRVPKSTYFRGTVWRKFILQVDRQWVYLDKKKLHERPGLLSMVDQFIDNQGTAQFPVRPEEIPVKHDPNYRVGDVSFGNAVIQRRLQTCYQCKHCVTIDNRSCCELVELKHPGKSAIQSGVRRKDVYCPIHEWPDDPLNWRNRGLRPALRFIGRVLRRLLLGNQICHLIGITKASQGHTRRKSLPSTPKRKAPVS